MISSDPKELDIVMDIKQIMKCPKPKAQKINIKYNNFAIQTSNIKKLEAKKILEQNIEICPW